MVELPSACRVHPAFRLELVRVGEQYLVVICYDVGHPDRVASRDGVLK